MVFNFDEQRKDKIAIAMRPTKIGKYSEFRKNPRTPKEMTNEICIEFKTVIFC